MGAMSNWTDPDLFKLQGLYMQNDESYVVRRCVQRFKAGEMTAGEAVALICRDPGVRDDDRFPDIPSGI